MGCRRGGRCDGATEAGVKPYKKWPPDPPPPRVFVAVLVLLLLVVLARMSF